MTLQSPWPSVAALLPHRGEMLLIDRVLDSAGDRTTVEATLKADAWYSDAQGNAPAWIGVELMAQAISAHASLVAIAAGAAPRRGVLLGTRAYSATVPAFHAGDRLTIAAQMSFHDESGLAAYVCTIERAGTRLAAAELKVYEPADFAQYILADGAA